MAKLHELLAAEKTPTAAWNTVSEETLKKFGTPTMFEGHSVSLKMIIESSSNEATENAAREEKPVITTVYDTLDYALDMFVKSEDLQAQKNATNATARGTVIWKGQELLKDLPIDELLGLEARLVKVRQILEKAPTLDASKHWDLAPHIGAGIWQLRFPEETTKTEKVMTPVIMAPATDKHPAQVQALNKDVTIGLFTKVKRSGAATAAQKAEVLNVINDLLVEIKKARMRANEAEVVNIRVGSTIKDLIMNALKVSSN